MFTLTWKLVQYIKKKAEKNMTIAIIGLDNSGKSTLHSSLRGLKDAAVIPTVGFDPSVTRHGNYILHIFDLGGGKRIRGIWNKYFADVHGVVFVVDAADRSRFEEAKAELATVLGSDLMKGKPILILANKQDLPSAVPIDEVSAGIGAEAIQNSYHIKACTAITHEGSEIDTNITQGLNWLFSQVTKNYAALNLRIEADTRVRKEEEDRIKKEKRARLAETRRRREEEEAAREAAENAAKAEGGHGHQGNIENQAPAGETARPDAPAEAVLTTPRAAEGLRTPMSARPSPNEKLPPISHPGVVVGAPLSAIPRSPPSEYKDLPLGARLSAPA